jgi:hypothetical protein
LFEIKITHRILEIILKMQRNSPLSKLLNLSNIANILPYYGEYNKKRDFVKNMNPALLHKFSSILGGVFSNFEYNDIVYE